MSSMGGHAVVVSTNPDGQWAEYGADGRTRTGQESVMLFDPIEGSALNTNIWDQSMLGMTAGVVNGVLTLNSGSDKVSGDYCILKSIMQPVLLTEFPIYLTTGARLVPQPNTVIEFGMGIVAGASAPTDGCFYRYAGGVLYGVINYNGTETTLVINPSPMSDEFYLFETTIMEGQVLFAAEQPLAGGDLFTTSLAIPKLQGTPTSAAHLQVFMRIYNTGVPTNAAQLMISSVNVTQEDLSRSKPWSETVAAFGRSFYQGPATASLTQTANHVNSTVPATAALSNTVPSYSTLGGKFLFAAPAGAETDFALFGFQVPVPFQFHLFGVAISSANIGAAVGLTASILEWSIAVNSSAASLATSEAPPASWAPRRIPLGSQAFPALGAIGFQPPDLVRTFAPGELVVDAGRYLHIIVRIPVGLATGSQIIRGAVTFLGGYFE